MRELIISLGTEPDRKIIVDELPTSPGREMTRQTLNEQRAREFPFARLSDSKNPFRIFFSAVSSSEMEKAAERCCENVRPTLSVERPRISEIGPLGLNFLILSKFKEKAS